MHLFLFVVGGAMLRAMTMVLMMIAHGAGSGERGVRMTRSCGCESANAFFEIALLGMRGWSIMHCETTQ